MAHFSDGVNVDTSGKLRTMRLPDGWYVVGDGMMMPMADAEEAREYVKSNTDS